MQNSSLLYFYCQRSPFSLIFFQLQLAFCYFSFLTIDLAADLTNSNYISPSIDQTIKCVSFTVLTNVPGHMKHSKKRSFGNLSIRQYFYSCGCRGRAQRGRPLFGSRK